MGTLLIKLAGPLQSWGCDSRFTERKTRHEPTKSGVVGILSAALGRRREDPIDDLAGLPIMVRVDQPGRYERDFQTAHTRKFDKASGMWVFDKSLPLSYRYYLADAVFVVGIEVPEGMLDELSTALVHPAFPLYLGRRSCPPAEKLLIGTFPDTGLLQAIREHPWEATSRSLLRCHAHEQAVSCALLRDARPEDSGTQLREAVRDVPLSFSQEWRQYDWRTVVREEISVPNPHYVVPRILEHDPMAALEKME